jgi:uncharacterized protein
MIIKRNFYIEKINKALISVPLIVLTGARQVGKTTIMNMLDLKGVKIHLNGQNPDDAAIFEKFSILEQYLKTNFNQVPDGYLLIDEFQFIDGISVMLKLITDKYKSLKVICTGSSSLDILQKVEESLAGRVRIIEVYSLSFNEYLQFIDNELFITHRNYDLTTPDEITNKRLNPIMNDYIIYGGLPRVALTKDNNEKIELLDDVYRTYLLHDVRSYVKNQDSVGFNKLLKILSAQIGNMININEISSLSGLKYKKCEEYIYLLEQMFVIIQLEPFLSNKRKTISKMKKVYFTDLGLRNIIYNSFGSMDIRLDNGFLFENYIFLELKRILGKIGQIYFYRTFDGSEVDFIINNLNELFALEVKYKKLVKPISLKNIKSFNSHENVKQSYLVNLTLNQKIEKLNYIQGYLVNKLQF